jgi:hypothetical protein
MFFVVQRATILIPSGPEDDRNRKHLFIFLTDPIGSERETLLVPIASVRPGQPHDSTCLLYKGDHLFIRGDSYVNYLNSRIESAEKIENAVKKGLFVPRDPMDGAIFARVCKGIEESRFVAEKVLVFYERSRSI